MCNRNPTNVLIVCFKNHIFPNNVKWSTKFFRQILFLWEAFGFSVLMFRLL